ncbi:MAG: carboxylate--amine ligase [Candidatus Helarchaeota archaeon]
MTVLITDASYKHTLGVIRSLGKKNFYVIAASSFRNAHGFFSKYCKERIIYPNPKDIEKFTRFTYNYVKKKKVKVLLPIGYNTNYVLSKFKEKFTPYTKLPIANFDAMKIACDKEKTMMFAENIGVRIPRTYHSIQEIDKFPVVIKGIKESGSVSYIYSRSDFSKVEIKNTIIQEYIPGTGYGFFSLFNNGDVRAIFMHKRLREYPPTGGASTAAESIYDPKLKKIGLRLMKALNWHGVAMAEFKKDSRTGDYILLEINPKFWGSLDLAISAGVDFPFLLTKMAIDGDIKSISNYKIGVKFSWLFPDEIRHLLASPKAIKAILHDLLEKNTKTNIWLSDLKPNLFQIRSTLRHIYLSIRRKI